MLLLSVPCLALADDDDVRWSDEADEEAIESSGSWEIEAPAAKTPESAPAADSAPASDSASAPVGAAPDTPRQIDEAPPVRRSIAVVVSPRDPAANQAAAAFEAELARALESNGRLEPIDLLHKLGGAADPMPRPEAESHFEAGKQAYDNLDLDVAAREYLAALKLLLERPETVVPAQVAHGFALAGAAYLLNGDNDRATTSFKRAALIAPDYAPPPTDFSPDIIEAYAAAKAETDAGPKGALTVTANVAHAAVFLGGRPLGVAPVKIDELPVGRHHLVVVSRTRRPWASFVEVNAGVATVTAQLEDLPTAAPLDRALETAVAEMSGQKAGFGARDLGNLLETGYLVLGTARTETVGTLVEYQAYDLASGRMALSGRKTVVPGAPAFEAEMQTLAPQLAAALLDPPVVAKADDGPPITERAWFWPVVGGTAAAVVIGGVVYAIAATRDPPQAPSLILTGVP
ncbi:MAG: PEGA domain-containing protein [Myxococcales bacterium]|jgi:tetratricopeptide (TPR) repeat protein